MQKQAEKIKLVGANHSGKKLNKIVVNTSMGYTALEIKNIVHLKADNNYTKVFLSDGKQLMISKTLKDFESALNGNYFVRVHRSNIINLAYLKEFLNNGNLVLSDGATINISRRKHKEFLAILKTYFYHL